MESPWEPLHTAAGLGPWPSLSPVGMVPRSGGGTGKELVTQKSWCHAPDPFSSLASGRRHRVLQDPTVLLRDVPTACVVSTWHHKAGGTRHACVFPSQDVRLFTHLHLRVLDAATNQIKYWRELSVEAVGESLPSGNNCDSRTVLRLSGSPALLYTVVGVTPCMPGTEAALGVLLGSPGRTKGCPDGGCYRRANTLARSLQVSLPPR